MFIHFQSGDVSVFEWIIRYVGGFLSLYALTGDNLFKKKAQEVSDKLLPAFNSITGEIIWIFDI
jgi:mannosyl-oligosaccharide alpha-1,2-mannosidase